MIRLAWRQFRTEAAIGLVALAAVAVVLAATGPNLVSLYRLTPRHVLTADRSLRHALMALLLVAPALVGLFFGAPLIARELETGTFRLAWTQSISRSRWLAVKLVLAGLASSLIAGGLSLMTAWWANPINLVAQDRFSQLNFGLFGIVPFGYGLFAFALGATTGVLFRRVLPALASTLAGYVAVRVAVTYWVRSHFETPAIKSLPLTTGGIVGFELGPNGAHLMTGANIPNAWVLWTRIADKAGHAPTSSFLRHACPTIFGFQGRGTAPPRKLAFQHCIAAVGARFHDVVTYQPASRYWPFQAYETALFVVLALALAGVCFWWVRRRLT